MPTTSAVVVGAGHSGLAASRRLTERSIDHVVLERGDVAHSWRTQRWDSLRLLTPTWLTRLPGATCATGDPDGYLTAAQFADFLQDYANGAPIHGGTTVESVATSESGFEVHTDQGVWRTGAVVLSTGLTAPVLPGFAGALPPGITSVHAVDYRRPDQLPAGGVLVVGAAASGVQIAEELHRSGRPVTLAVGEHTRLPRRYRDRDILWWLDAAGVLDEGPDQIDDLLRARNLPSMQLIGAPRTVDLNHLQSLGVRVVGRLAGMRDGRAQFAGSLANMCALADLKLGRLLDTIDTFAGGTGERAAPTEVPAPVLDLDLRSGEFASVVWATGIAPDFSCLDAPTFDRRGRLVHDGGITRVPGLYVLGLPVLRRRRSSLIDGAAGDTEVVIEALHQHLRAT
ncbi:MAG TPA: NAD(P)-binding domain-containing protein, partial [Sporichthyaceae bacterium]